MIFFAIFFAAIGLFMRFRRGSKSSGDGCIRFGSLLVTVSGHSCSAICQAWSGMHIVSTRPTAKPMRKKWFRFSCFNRTNFFMVIPICCGIRRYSHAHFLCTDHTAQCTMHCAHTCSLVFFFICFVWSFFSHGKHKSYRTSHFTRLLG